MSFLLEACISELAADDRQTLLYLGENFEEIIIFALCGCKPSVPPCCINKYTFNVNFYTDLNNCVR